MPKRQSVSKISSEEVMGEGSYIKVRHLTWGETKTARDAAARTEKSGEGFGDAGLSEMEKLIEAAVVDWNWVDDQGEPMPLFGEGTSINDLYTTEVNFLVDAILQLAQRKN